MLTIMQMVMAVFAYIYHQSFIVPQSLSIEMIMDQVCTYNRLQRKYSYCCLLIINENYIGVVDTNEPHV